MFTGLVQAMGVVAQASGDSQRLVLETSLVADPGDSVAVNGCCLTVAKRRDDGLEFDVITKTLERTSLGDLRVGDPVNLEPAVRAGDPLGGHWVQGHVDGVGVVDSVNSADGSFDLWIRPPAALLKYCVDRGSITVDGVSLTVMGLDEHRVAVSLIPETRSRTTLGKLRPEARVNLEADILARYVERLLERG